MLIPLKQSGRGVTHQSDAAGLQMAMQEARTGFSQQQALLYSKQKQNK